MKKSLVNGLLLVLMNLLFGSYFLRAINFYILLFLTYTLDYLG